MRRSTSWQKNFISRRVYWLWDAASTMLLVWKEPWLVKAIFIHACHFCWAAACNSTALRNFHWRIFSESAYCIKLLLRHSGYGCQLLHWSWPACSSYNVSKITAAHQCVLLTVPQTQAALSTGTFCVAALGVWNALLSNVCQCDLLLSTNWKLSILPLHTHDVNYVSTSVSFVVTELYKLSFIIIAHSLYYILHSVVWMKISELSYENIVSDICITTFLWSC